MECLRRDQIPGAIVIRSGNGWYYPPQSVVVESDAEAEGWPRIMAIRP